MKTAYINARMPKTPSDAFIVEDGRFTHVGRKRAILNQKVDLIVDLKNQAVLPGFNDAHLHLLGLGKTMDMVDVSKVTTIAQLIERLKASDAPTIIGRGYSETQFDSKRSPTKADLDKVSKEKPVLLYRFCSHVIIANQAAIDKAYTLHGGYPDAEGQYDLSTGRFTESSRQWLMALESESKRDFRRFILKGQDHLIKHGVTAVGSDDFGVVASDYEDVLDVFKLLGQSGKLKLRVLEQVNIADETRFIDFLNKDYPHTAYGRFTLGPVKLLLDGSLGARTAAMREPYSDAPGETGTLVYDEAFIHRRLDLAREKGMDYAMHAIGDRTIETLIQVGEKRQGENYRDAIIHAQLADAFQIERMEALGLGAQVQPAFISSDTPIVRERLGERADTTYLFNTMIEKGVKTAFSTDAPIEDVNPFLTLYTAITRKTPEGKDTFNHGEAVPFKTALDAYTKVPAYFMRMEDRLGAIQKGFLADFIVVKDLDYADAESLLRAKVLETYIEGECVYSDRTLTKIRKDPKLGDEAYVL
ncbi:MAG: amidohydrolase [Bacillota bacterium]